jgi:hypothetical protein
LQVLHMVGMGIEITWAVAALRRTRNDVAAAVAMCFETDMAAAVAQDAAAGAAAPAAGAPPPLLLAPAT